MGEGYERAEKGKNVRFRAYRIVVRWSCAGMSGDGAAMFGGKLGKPSEFSRGSETKKPAQGGFSCSDRKTPSTTLYIPLPTVWQALFRYTPAFGVRGTAAIYECRLLTVVRGSKSEYGCGSVRAQLAPT